MNTLHERAIIVDFETAIIDDPRWGPFLVESRRRLNAGEFPMRDAITQPYGALTLEETFAFAKVWGWLMAQLVGVCRIRIGDQPLADRGVEDNQTKLDRALPEPFSANVQSERGYSANGDGCLSWSTSIVLDLLNFEGPPTKWICRPTTIPLEIGTTLGSRTALHIACGGVARWPYGAEEITVFVTRPEFHAERTSLWPARR